MNLLNQAQRKLLLSEHTSSTNKMHFIAHWHTEGFFVEHQWAGVGERVKVRFEPDGKWHTCKSILDDFISSLKGDDEK